MLENPKNIVNIASTLRNVSAFGVEKVYLIDTKNASPNVGLSRSNRQLTKLSVGANKWIFVKYYSSTAECMAYLRKKGYTIAVTSSHTKGKDNLYLYEGTFTQKKLSVCFGNETHGISDEAVSKADMCIQIPMGGVVESLNLGTSTGIILSYIGYQRLKFVYSNKKVRFKPKGLAEQKMRSWESFINPHR